METMPEIKIWSEIDFYDYFKEKNLVQFIERTNKISPFNSFQYVDSPFVSLQFFEKYPLVKFLFFKGVKEEESLIEFDNLSFFIMKRTIVGYSKTPNYKYGIDSLMEALIEDQNFLMMDKMGVEKAEELLKNSIYIESEINGDYDFNKYDSKGINKYVEIEEKWRGRWRRNA